MRSRQTRHLQSILRADMTPPTAKLSAKAAAFALSVNRDVERAEEPRQNISPEFNGHQYAIFLLHCDAGIEHALMVQYLYGAYSLGGPHVPPEYHQAVERWQETILGVAKEEIERERADAKKKIVAHQAAAEKDAAAHKQKVQAEASAGDLRV